MILDSHQHFWQYDPDEYSWINDEMSILKKDHLPETLKLILNDHGIRGTVAVQARQSVEETRWLLQLARENDFIKGVVGWVDLRSPDIVEQLSEFKEESKLVGVRHVVQDEPDITFMIQKDFQRGIQALYDFQFTYDILIFPNQLEPAIALVKRFPEQRFVLDHIAKPYIKFGVQNSWEPGIQKLAENENVYCKVSGMITEANWNNWKPEDFKPYLDIVSNAFGPHRIMFGSDWPVCTVAGTYSEVMNLVVSYIEQFSTKEKEAILYKNAMNFYQLND